MKYLISILFIITSLSSYGQKKIYQWGPPESIFSLRNDVNLGDTIFISVVDRTIKPKKIVTNTNFEQIKGRIESAVSNAFPNSRFFFLDNSYNKETDKLIKISVVTYHAGFGTEISTGVGSVGGSLSTMVFPKGKWNAVTLLNCETFNSGDKQSKELAATSSKDNLWGKSTSRRALEESYNSAMNQLLIFIESSLGN